MTPGTVILLHTPDATAAAWGDLPEMLRSYGLDVVAPDIPEDTGMRYVARASLVIAATAPATPLVLVAHGGSGPLLPAIATAQRAAHRPIGGYVFIDAELPGPADGTEQPPPPDWPEAPCGYLHMSSEHDQEARQARLRGWPVKDLPETAPPTSSGPRPPTRPRAGAAQALSELIATL